MKVAHLIKGLGRGGAELLLPALARAGGRDLVSAVGYFMPWKDALVPELCTLGVGVTCFETRSVPSMLAAIPAVTRWIRTERPALVHAHLPWAGVVARVAGRRAGVPVVYTEHNVMERYHPVTRAANLLTWGVQDVVVAVSDEVAASVRARAGGRVPVVTVRNGIDLDRFDGTRWSRGEAKRRVGIPPDAPVVGTAARFRTQKRLDLWVGAAARIAADNPGTRFLLVGDGPERERVRGWLERAGLAPVTTLPGQREDVAPYLAAMDVFLVSSDFEGLPLALLEAMAFGLPVVATAVGGIPEVVVDQVSGLLVPKGDVDGLAEAVGRLLHDPSLGERLGAEARSEVAVRFSIQRMARELEAVYERVLGRERARVE